MRRALLPFAAVAALVLPSCDQPPPVSIELEPLFQHKPGHGGGGNDDGGGGSGGGSQTYEYTHTGDVTTDPATAPGTKNVGKGRTGESIVMSGGQNDTDLLFAAAFLAALDPNGSCFDTRVEFAGALRGSGSTVVGTYFFAGTADDGVTAIAYALELTGTVVGPFPPAPSEAATVTWDTARMGTEGKGKGACTGSPAITGGVTVVGIS